MKLLSFLFDMFGRARRRDFWLFFISLGVFYLLAFTSHDATAHTRGYEGDVNGLYSLSWFSHNDVAFIALAVLQIASLAVIVKRFHDRDKSALWALLLLVPVIGWAWMIFELGFLPGTPGSNRFGAAPRAQTKTL